MFTVTRKFTFDAGHRVLGHEGKCRHLHGHTYVAEVTVADKAGLDTLGRVVDFGVIKKEVGDWIDENWDHNFLCHPDDPVQQLYKLSAQHRDNVFGLEAMFCRLVAEMTAGRPPFVMPDRMNPTAENMARVLFATAGALLGDKGVSVIRVRLHETPNCYAEYPGR